MAIEETAGNFTTAEMVVEIGGGASQSRIDLYKNHCGSGDGGVWREVLAPTLGKEGETIRWAVSK